jgi:hypothetical protein
MPVGVGSTVVKVPQAHLGEIKGGVQPVPTFAAIIMKQGHPVVFHSPEKKKVAVHLYVLNDCFEWRTLDFGVFKSVTSLSSTNKVPLKEIEFVVWDRQSPNFIGKVSDDLCFSLVTAQKTIDFECRSKDERDALCQGLAWMIKENREGN